MDTRVWSEAGEAERRERGAVVCAVEGRGLVKRFGGERAGVSALDGVDLVVPAGQFLCVMGPSGSGKSTLLHLLAGLERPSAGRVRIGDTDVASLSEDEATRFRRRRLGIVFQFFNLVPTLTVLENVALPLLLEGHRLASVRPRARALLARLGLAGREERPPHALSGGEMQRVAIARALVVDPLLVLADEPTGNLDSKTGEEILALLRGAPDGRRVTTILVTHDPRAAGYADRVILLRDGRVEDDLCAWRAGGAH